MKKCGARILAVAFTVLPVLALAEDRPAPRAALLSDAELDKITAGSVEFAVHAVFNPGNADQSKINGNQFHFVIGDSGDKATGFILIINPAQTVIKCIGGGSSCF